MTDTPEEGSGSAGPGSIPGTGQSALPGGRIFTLEGRAAPGLYLVGWLASIMGGAILLVAAFAGLSGPAALVLVLGGCAVLGIGLVSAAGSQAIERRAHAVPGYEGPSPFLVFGATLPITLLIVIVVFVPASALGLSADSPLGALLSVALTALVYIGLVRLLVVDPGALRWADMGLHRPRSLIADDMAWSAMLALPVILATAVLGAVLVRIVGTAPESPLPASNSNVDLLFNFIAAAVVAPIGEEVFFRGFATTAWMRSLGERSAILRSGLFFAFVHVLTVGGASFGEAFGRAIVAFAGRLPVSFTLGWVYLRRRSLYASIALHGTFNGLLVLLGEIAARSAGVRFF